MVMSLTSSAYLKVPASAALAIEPWTSPTAPAIAIVEALIHRFMKSSLRLCRLLFDLPLEAALTWIMPSPRHVRAALAPGQQSALGQLHQRRQCHRHQGDDQDQRHDARDVEASAEGLHQQAKPAG